MLAHSYGQSLFLEAGTPGADSTQARMEWRGYARGSAYGGSRQFDYASVFGEAALQGTLRKDKVLLFADVRLREGLQLGARGTTLQLKEAYAAYQSPKWDVRLGNQIVAWGRADAFSLFNGITPSDYFLLSGEPDDQTLPNFMLRAKYRFSPQIELEGIAMPYYRPSVYRYDLFRFDERARFAETALPSNTWASGAAAARLNFEWPGMGLALSYFRGYDPFYGFSIQSVDLGPVFMPSIVYQPQPYRKQQAGLDFALPLRNWILRGEVAGRWTRDYQALLQAPNPDLSCILGVEREFWGITAVAQYIGKYVFDFQPLQEPVLEIPFDNAMLAKYLQEVIVYNSEDFNRKIFQQQKQGNHALFLSLSRAFAHETLRAQVSGYYNITSEEYLLRPELQWQISDALRAKVGGSVMGGPEGNVFRYARDVLNGAFVELRVSF